MKTIISTNEIAHRWAHGIPGGLRLRNGHGDNHSAQGNALYSYASCIGLILEPGKAVLINGASYSATTSKHQGLAFSAVSHFANVFRVECRHDGYSLAELAKNPRQIAKKYRDAAVERLSQSYRATKRKAHLETACAGYCANYNQVSRYFKLRLAELTPEKLAKDAHKAHEAHKAERAQALGRELWARRRATDSATLACQNYLHGLRHYEPTRSELVLVSPELKAQVKAHQAAGKAIARDAAVAALLSGETRSIEWDHRENLRPEQVGPVKERLAAIAAEDEAEAVREAYENARAFLLCEVEAFPSGYESRLDAPTLARVQTRRIELAQARITSWLAGQGSIYSLPRDLPTMLRAWDGQMETSKGATVPLADAERTFRFVSLVRAKGWHRNGETHAIGHYELDAVNPQGVVAGCHRVSWAEVERFAQSQGWLAAPTAGQ